MDERDYKALNKEEMNNTGYLSKRCTLCMNNPCMENSSKCEMCSSYFVEKEKSEQVKEMSNTEEINKLSAEEYLIDQFGDEEQFLLYSQEFPIWQTLMKTMESFASMRVEQAKKEWENEIKELKQEIYFLNNSSNFQ